MDVVFYTDSRGSTFPETGFIVTALLDRAPGKVYNTDAQQWAADFNYSIMVYKGDK